MPTYIVKSRRNEDYYVKWSSVVDAPVAHGTRAQMREPEDRLRRADERGTSADWDGVAPEDQPYGWADEHFLVTNVDSLPWPFALLPRTHLREFCERLSRGESVADLVLPTEDEPQPEAGERS